jgi:hypothetical protein
MADTWEQARIAVPGPGYPTPPARFVWQPPWPLFVLGVRFSEPARLGEVHICLNCVASDNQKLVRDLVRAYPEMHLDLLDGEYTEWRPQRTPRHLLRVGEQCAVTLRSPVPGGWVELLHESVVDYQARVQSKTARHEKKLADCAQSLGAAVPPAPGKRS